MNPKVSQDFVNDLMVRTDETDRTVSSTSLSSPPNIQPKKEASSADWSRKMTKITAASWTRGNRMIARTGARIVFIISGSLGLLMRRLQPVFNSSVLADPTTYSADRATKLCFEHRPGQNRTSKSSTSGRTSTASNSTERYRQTGSSVCSKVIFAL